MNFTKTEYRLTEKDNLFHVPDHYVTLADAASFLDISRQKLQKLIDADLVVWLKPFNSNKIFIESRSLVRVKYPLVPIEFPPLKLQNSAVLDKALSSARHEIAAAMGLSPGHIKICFELPKAAKQRT